MDKVDIQDTLTSVARQLNLLAKINSIYINDDDAQAMADQLIELGGKINSAADTLKGGTNH